MSLSNKKFDVFRDRFLRFLLTTHHTWWIYLRSSFFFWFLSPKSDVFRIQYQKDFSKWIEQTEDLEMTVDEHDFIVEVLHDKTVFHKVTNSILKHTVALQLKWNTLKNGISYSEMVSELFPTSHADLPSPNIDERLLSNMDLTAPNLQELSNMMPFGIISSPTIRYQILQELITVSPSSSATPANNDILLRFDIMDNSWWKVFELILCGAITHLQLCHLDYSLETHDISSNTLSYNSLNVDDSVNDTNNTNVSQDGSVNDDNSNGKNVHSVDGDQDSDYSSFPTILQYVTQRNKALALVSSCSLSYFTQSHSTSQSTSQSTSHSESISEPNSESNSESEPSLSLPLPPIWIRSLTPSLTPSPPTNDSLTDSEDSEDSEDSQDSDLDTHADIHVDSDNCVSGESDNESPSTPYFDHMQGLEPPPMDINTLILQFDDDYAEMEGLIHTMTLDTQTDTIPSQHTEEAPNSNTISSTNELCDVEQTQTGDVSVEEEREEIGVDEVLTKPNEVAEPALYSLSVQNIEQSLVALELQHDWASLSSFLQFLSLSDPSTTQSNSQSNAQSNSQSNAQSNSKPVSHIRNIVNKIQGFLIHVLAVDQRYQRVMKMAKCPESYTIVAAELTKIESSIPVASESDLIGAEAVLIHTMERLHSLYSHSLSPVLYSEDNPLDPVLPTDCELNTLARNLLSIVHWYAWVLVGSPRILCANHKVKTLYMHPQVSQSLAALVSAHLHSDLDCSLLTPLGHSAIHTHVAFHLWLHHLLKHVWGFSFNHVTPLVHKLHELLTVTSYFSD